MRRARPSLVGLRGLPFGLGACLLTGAPGCASSRNGKAPPDAPTLPAAGAGAGAAPLEPRPEDLGPLLEPLRAETDLPALAAAVLDSERLLAAGAVGARRRGDPATVTLRDRWHLGSNTKAMTATLIALLVDAGKLGFDARVGDLLPEAAPALHPDHAATTIEMLLGHRAGLPGDVPPEIWSELWKPGDPVEQRRWFAREMLKRAPRSRPGARAVYSNSGYIIAGAAAERVGGASWEALLRARLFEPLGMRSCGFGAPAAPGAVDEPWGHRPSDAGAVPVPPGPLADNPPALGPAGTVHCALEDWARFLRLHLRAARGAPTPLGSLATLRRLQAPGPDGTYASGWLVVSRPWAGGTALTHAGSNTMFFATAWLAPAKDRALLAVTNQGGDAAALAVDRSFAPLIARYVR
jgi:CubicO group peptidase (beta-lactamase class C family)